MSFRVSKHETHQNRILHLHPKYTSYSHRAKTRNESIIFQICRVTNQIQVSITIFFILLGIEYGILGLEDKLFLILNHGAFLFNSLRLNICNG